MRPVLTPAIARGIGADLQRSARGRSRASRRPAGSGRTHPLPPRPTPRADGAGGPRPARAARARTARARRAKSSRASAFTSAASTASKRASTSSAEIWRPCTIALRARRDMRLDVLSSARVMLPLRCSRARATSSAVTPPSTKPVDLIDDHVDALLNAFGRRPRAHAEQARVAIRLAGTRRPRRPGRALRALPERAGSTSRRRGSYRAPRACSAVRRASRGPACRA